MAGHRSAPPHDHTRALAQRVCALREDCGWTRERLASLASGTPACFGNGVTFFMRGSLPKNARYLSTVPISLTIFFTQAGA